MGGTVAIRGSSGVDVVTPTEENYPALASTEVLTDVVGMLTDNVGEDGVSLWDLTRIKMPTGGATTWEIPGEFAGDESSSEKKITMVLVHWQAVRALFPTDSKGETMLGEPPLCSASDGKRPNPGGLYGDGGEREHLNLPVSVAGAPPARCCAGCPMSKFGSHPKEGRKGQACQDRRLLFGLRSEDMLPVMISVPPTSLKDLRQTMVKLTTRFRVHYSSMVLELSLKREEKGGNPFAIIQIRPVGQLSGAQPESQGGPVQGSPAWVARQYSEQIAKLLTPEAMAQVITADVVTDSVGSEMPDHLGGDFADHGDDGLEIVDDDRQSA